MDGSNVEALIAEQNVPNSLALDVAGGQIYWTGIDPEAEEGGIYRANLDGSNVEALIAEPEHSIPFSLALDVAGGQIYWTAWTAIDPEGFAEEGIICRANLDGSNVETLISEHSIPGFLALDAAGGQIYWTATEGVYRANLDGSNVETLITGMEEAAVIVLGP